MQKNGLYLQDKKEKMTERKFKVEDRVKDYLLQQQGRIVFIDEGANLPYLIVCTDKNGIRTSSWRKASDLTLIEPDRQYKTGDTVWYKNWNRPVIFSSYHETNGNMINFILPDGGGIGSAYIEFIEPYTGQDKPKEGTQKERNSRLAAELVNEVTRLHPELKQLRPYTVILKSGVKVGISSTMFDYINEQSDIIGAVQTVEDGKFFLHQIEAIVPTENLMP